MVLHQAFRARPVRNKGIGGEVQHGVTSGVSCETSLNKCVTPHLHREYLFPLRFDVSVDADADAGADLDADMDAYYAYIYIYI